MHKFMRTVGFSMYQKKQDMAKLLKRLAKEAEMTGRLGQQEGLAAGRQQGSSVNCARKWLPA